MSDVVWLVQLYAIKVHKGGNKCKGTQWTTVMTFYL